MKKIGRPKGENNKDILCSIRMNQNTYKRLELYCKRMNIAKSEVIREAILLYMDEHQNK